MTLKSLATAQLLALALFPLSAASAQIALLSNGIQIELAAERGSCGSAEAIPEDAGPDVPNIWIEISSGSLFLFTKIDAGGYSGTCGGVDYSCAYDVDVASTFNDVEDPDYYPYGEAADCLCQYSTIPHLGSDMNLYRQAEYARWDFSSDEIGLCFDQLPSGCPARAQRLTATGYNTYSLYVNDRNSEYAGKVHVWGRLTMTSLAQLSDGCEDIDSFIEQEVSAEYLNGPATSSEVVPCYIAVALDVASYTDVSGPDLHHDGYVDETGGAEDDYDSGWVRLTPTGGICLGDDFSFGFKFYMDCYGSWAASPTLTLELGVTTIANSTCP